MPSTGRAAAIPPAMLSRGCDRDHDPQRARGGTRTSLALQLIRLGVCVDGLELRRRNRVSPRVAAAPAVSTSIPTTSLAIRMAQRPAPTKAPLLRRVQSCPVRVLHDADHVTERVDD